MANEPLIDGISNRDRGYSGVSHDESLPQGRLVTRRLPIEKLSPPVDRLNINTLKHRKVSGRVPERSSPVVLIKAALIGVATAAGFLTYTSYPGSIGGFRLGAASAVRHEHSIQPGLSIEYQSSYVQQRLKSALISPEIIFDEDHAQGSVSNLKPTEPQAKAKPLSANQQRKKVHSIIRKYAPKHPYPEDLANRIVLESTKQGYDPLFVAAVIKSESTFNTFARSHVGAQGLMQIMPKTGKWLSDSMDIPKGKLTDPGYNLQLGISYLKHLEELYGGNRVFVLIAYNWGPGRVESAADGKRRVPPEVMGYAVKILNDLRRWNSEAATS